MSSPTLIVSSLLLPISLPLSHTTAYNVLPPQEYDKWLWAIDTSPVGQQPTAKDWVYPPDQEREVTNQSLGNLVTLMKVVDKAAKEKRLLTMTGE